MLDNAEISKFNKLLKIDPNPGQKNRCHRIDNILYVPGWVFGKEPNEVEVKYKKLNKVFNSIGYSTQLIYDILNLGLTNISDRPVCPICDKPTTFNNFWLGYTKTCKDYECRRQSIKSRVTDLWRDEDYRKTQVKSHQEWASVPENKQKMRETSINIWKRPDYRSKLVEIHKNYILNNPDKILTSVHGVFRSNRQSIDIHYDSSWEKKFLELCERNNNVIISYDRAYLDIPYVYQDKEHTFFPDFKVCLNNGKTLLVEIKAKWLIEHQPKNLEKFKHGEGFVSNSSTFDKFIVLTDDELFFPPNYKKFKDDNLIIDFLLSI